MGGGTGRYRVDFLKLSSSVSFRYWDVKIDETTEKKDPMYNAIRSVMDLFPDASITGFDSKGRDVIWDS
jgi:hypothetical protein